MYELHGDFRDIVIRQQRGKRLSFDIYAAGIPKGLDFWRDHLPAAICVDNDDLGLCYGKRLACEPIAKDQTISRVKHT